MAFQVALVLKNLPAVCLQRGKSGSIPRWRKSPGAGNGKPVQYFCLENPMMEELGWLQSMGSQRVQADWANNTHLHANAGDIKTLVWSLDLKDSLEKEIATHSSILAWRIPWTEEPGRQQSMGSQEVDTNEWLSMHTLTHTHTHTHTHTEDEYLGCQSHPTVHFFNVKRLYWPMLHRGVCQNPPSVRVDQFLNKYTPTLHLCMLPFTGPPWFRLLRYHQVLSLPSLPPFSQLDG